MLAALLGIDDPRFATNRDRVGAREDLVAAIERALSGDNAETWLTKLREVGVPAGKVRTLDEVYSWDQTLSQGLLVDVEHPALGTVSLPGPPLRFDDNTFAGAREHHLPPPRLGEHNGSVRAWLDGLDADTHAYADGDAVQLDGHLLRRGSLPDRELDADV